jgi:hypothetical protein
VRPLPCLEKRTTIYPLLHWGIKLGNGKLGSCREAVVQPDLYLLSPGNLSFGYDICFFSIFKKDSDSLVKQFEDSRQRVVFVIEFENQDDLNRYIDDPTHVALEMNMGSDAVTEGVRNNQYINGFWG